MLFKDCSWQHQMSERIATLALLLSPLITPIVGFAQQPDSLTGLDRIEVKVSVYIDLQKVDEKAVTERLRRQVERILRESHVPLIEGQSLDDPLGVWLYVDVQLIDLEDEAIVFINSSVAQGTSLLRDPSVKTTAITWTTSSWVVMDKDDAIISAEETTGEHMKLLVKDFLTFNQ